MIIFNQFIYYSFFSNIVYLLKTNHRIHTKISIFSIYLKFLAIRLMPLLSKNKSEIIVFENIISGFNFDSLYFLFGEIFVRNEYYFKNEQKDQALNIVDCGSNIGASVIFFKHYYPQSRIIAFEPEPTTYKKLKKNVEINNLQNVQTYNLGLSNRTGKLKFYFETEGSLTMSFSNERNNGKSINVDVCKLSDYIIDTVDFIKIDIEGAELDVLEDLYETKKILLIQEGIIEYHHNFDNKNRLASLLKILENSGFRYQIDGTNIPVISKNRFQDIIIYFYKNR